MTTAWMSLTWIGAGFADARLDDGKTCRIYLDAGVWHATLRAEPVGGPYRRWEDAFDALQGRLLGEGVVLRARQ